MRTHDDAIRTGAAFWPLKSGLIATYPALDHDELCDVVVIGAGITGALTALRLIEAGCQVVVVDRHDVALGSTAGSTGLLMYETDTELGDLAAIVGIERAVASWHAGRRAIDELEVLCQPRVGQIACSFRRRPSVYIAGSRAEARRLRDECALRQAHGFDAAWIEARELQIRMGLRSRGGIWSRGDGEVDPYRLTHRLLTTVQAAGGRVYDRTGVTRIATSSRGVRVITARGPVIRAAKVVVATGYHADTDVAPRKGRLHSTWAIVTEPVADLSGWADRALVWEARRPYVYLRVTDDHRVMVGGENERVLARKAEQLHQRLRRLMPEIAAEVAYAWAGTFATTADGLPFIGTRPDHPHTWFALGYGGNGITFSMIAANQARAWWEGSQPAQLFAFDRAAS